MMKKKTIGTLMIAALIVMAMLVGTALANGNAWIHAHKEFMGANETEFITTDDVYARGYFDNSFPGQGGRIYVVDHRPTWTDGDLLVDVSGGYETVGYGPGSFEFVLTWANSLALGHYDLILDLDAGVSGDWTDSGNITDPICSFFVSDPTGRISIEKTASPTAGAPGTDVTFTIAVENTGDFTLDPVIVADVLPTGMSYVSADSGGTELPEGTITWYELGPLDPHVSTTVSLVAHIDPGASGTLTDNVTVAGTLPLGGEVTDSDTADVNVEEQPPTPVEVPTLMPKGTMALVCLIFVVSAMSIIMRRRGT